MKTETTITREIKIIGHRKGQEACIMFINGDFRKCMYRTADSLYSVDDWRFLKVVAETIIDNLEKEKLFYEKAMNG